MKLQASFPLAGLVLAAVSVLSCGGSGGSPTSPQPPNSTITRANVIAGLFLGDGPLRATQGVTCSDSGFWRGFPRGSRIRVRLSTALSNGERSTIDAFLADFRGLIAGAYDLTIETTSEEDPIPGFLEVTGTSLNDAGVDAFCRPGTGGCAKYVFQAPGVFSGARTMARHQFGGNIHSHELVHGILGLCHLNGNILPDAMMTNPNSASVSTLNAIERQAVQAVLRSGLSPAATRADFERLGLVDPLGATAASSSPGVQEGNGAEDPPTPRPNRAERGGAAAGRERERQ